MRTPVASTAVAFSLMGLLFGEALPASKSDEADPMTVVATLNAQARDFCENPQMYGVNYGGRGAVSGSVNTSKIGKMIANISGQATVSANVQRYSGVEQSQLMQALANTEKCRIDALKSFERIYFKLRGDAGSQKHSEPAHDARTASKPKAQVRQPGPVQRYGRSSPKAKLNVPTIKDPILEVSSQLPLDQHVIYPISGGVSGGTITIRSIRKTLNGFEIAGEFQFDPHLSSKVLGQMHLIEPLTKWTCRTGLRSIYDAGGTGAAAVSVISPVNPKYSSVLHLEMKNCGARGVAVAHP